MKDTSWWITIFIESRIYRCDLLFFCFGSHGIIEDLFLIQDTHKQCHFCVYFTHKWKLHWEKLMVEVFMLLLRALRTKVTTDKKNTLYAYINICSYVSMYEILCILSAGFLSPMDKLCFQRVWEYTFDGELLLFAVAIFSIAWEISLLTTREHYSHESSAKKKINFQIVRSKDKRKTGLSHLHATINIE